MEKAFWQSIIDNNATIPAGYSLADLTAELLSYLGSSDTELREGPAYTLLERWINSGSYSHQDLWEMATRLQHNLTIGLGKQEDDTVFLRSFSVLILVEIVYYDLTHNLLKENEVRQLLKRALAYFLAEKDLRGYEREKGWVHAIAHTADFFWVLAQHRFVTAFDLARIMDAIAEKITAPVAHVYLYDEDERLVRAVMGVLQRNQLTLPLLTTWVEQLLHPRGRITWNESWESGKIMDVVRSEAETSARHNSKQFLRSLYFQLCLPGFAGLTFIDQRPAIADQLLPVIEDTLARIHAWC